MRPLLLTLLFIACILTTNAQQNYRIHLGIQGGVSNGFNLFHNRQLIAKLYTGPTIGAYADFCVYKRLWLFSSMELGYGFNVVKNYDNVYLYPPPSYKTGYFVGYANLAVAYNVCADSCRWQVYPYAGTSNFTYRRFYIQPLLGIEAKHGFGKRNHLALGLSWTFAIQSFGPAAFTDQLGYLNVYAKIGWGIWKRK